MGKLVALHWDQKQLLLATAQRAAGSLQIDRAEIVDLPAEGDQPNAIHEALKKLGIPRGGEVAVVIGRAGVEMRQLDVPPVPENELPGLVRFQAESHFTSLGPNSALDFVPIAENGHVETVLAATLPAKLIEDIKAQVEPSGLKVKHIVIRPFSSIEMLRVHRSAQSNCLIVNHFETEVDLTVARKGYVNLSRAIRITPPENEVDDLERYSAKIVAQEIRRTLAAATNQSDPIEVDRVIICGHQNNHAQLAELIKSDFDLPIEFFHPFEHVRVRPAVKRSLPDSDGRFTPLLGSLVQQGSPDNHAIDFLNPRKPVQNNDNRRKLILAGIAAGTLFLLAGLYAFFSLRSLDRQIADLEKEKSNLMVANSGVDQILGEVGKIDEWSQTEVAWLEELAEVSERYMYPDDVRANLFSGVALGNTGTITTTGSALNPATNSQLKQTLGQRPYFVDERIGRTGEGDKLKFDYQHILGFDLISRPLFIELIPKDNYSTPPLVQTNLTSAEDSAEPEQGSGETESDSNQPSSEGKGE